MRRWSSAGALALVGGLVAFGARSSCAGGVGASAADDHDRARRSRGDGIERQRWNGAPQAAFLAGDGGVGDGGVPEELPYCYDGLAIDESGRPVPRADVVVTEHDESTVRVIGETRTDDGGRFAVCVRDYEAYIDVYDDDGGWGRRGVYGEDGEALVVEVVESATISGRVLDPRGAPVSGAQVSIGSYRSSGQEGGRPERLGRGGSTLELTGAGDVRTDAQGRFEVRVVPDQLLAVEASAEGYAYETLGPLAMRPGAHHEVELQLREGAVMSGRVTGEGRPIAGARVVVSASEDEDRHLSTDVAGRFAVRGLAGDRFMLFVSAAGYVPEFRSLREAGEHEIELAREVELVVRARLTPALRDCIGRDSISLSAITGELREGFIADQTWDGDVLTARFVAIRAGSTRVHAYAADALEAIREVETQPGHRYTVDLELAPAPDQTILRVAVPGVPADDTARVGVGVRYLGRLIGARYTETAQGGAFCTVLAADEYDLVAQHGDRRAEETVRLRAGSSQWIPRMRAIEPSAAVPNEAEPERAEGRTCAAAIYFEQIGDAIVVTSAPPGDPRAWPGDRVLRVGASSAEAFYENGEELYGPEGTSVDVEIAREDGSRAIIRVPFDTDCDY